MDNWKENWDRFLKNKFGSEIPERFVVNLKEIDFYLPPLLGTTPDSSREIQKHNLKIAIF